MHAVSHTITIDFVVKPNKQKILIDILLLYGGLQLFELSELLNIPFNKMYSVLNGKAYFSKREVEKLVKCFCICCGE